MARGLSTYVGFAIVLLLFFIVQPEQILAHRMIVELIEPGTIEVRYDDGTKSGMASVTAFDKEGAILFQEYVDEAGYVYYDATITVHQIIADDGIGHRATWSDEIEKEQSDVPIIVRALLGVSILLCIAAFFYFRNDKEKQEQE